jgi:hypothetical protein
MYNDKLIAWDVKTFDTYFAKTQNQEPESVYTKSGSDVWASVLLNKTMMENGAADFAQTLWSLWIPRCLIDQDYSKPCTYSFLCHRTLPLDDNEVTGN